MRESEWKKKEEILQVLLWIMLPPPRAEKIQAKKRTLSSHFLFSALDLVRIEPLGD